MNREAIIILGKSGSGKTTLNRKLIADKSRLLVFDTLSEYRRAGFNALYISNVFELVEFLGENLDKNFRVVFDPPEPDEVFDAVCRIVYECLENISFAIEEIDFYVSPTNTPKHLKYIMRYGRHTGISVYITSRRPAEISPHIRAQATKIITFKQHEPRDIAWLKPVIGNEADKLKSLREYQYKEFLL